MGNDYRDWGVMPLANPEDVSDDPRLRGTRVGIGEDGNGIIASSGPAGAESEGGASLSSPGKARGGKWGGHVNMADAERARGEAIRARKAAEKGDPLDGDIPGGSGPLANPTARAGLAGTKASQGSAYRLPPVAPAKPRSPTPEELMKQAEAMLAGIREQGRDTSTSVDTAKSRETQVSPGFGKPAEQELGPDWLDEYMRRQ